MVPWSGGKVLVWDATYPDTLAPSYSSLATREAGAVAEEAERSKKAKYSHLERSHCLIPVAVDSRCIRPGSSLFGERPWSPHCPCHFGAIVHPLPATENVRSSAEGKRCGYSDLHQYH